MNYFQRFMEILQLSPSTPYDNTYISPFPVTPSLQVVLHMPAGGLMNTLPSWRRI